MLWVSDFVHGQGVEISEYFVYFLGLLCRDAEKDPPLRDKNPASCTLKKSGAIAAAIAPPRVTLSRRY